MLALIAQALLEDMVTVALGPSLSFSLGRIIFYLIDRDQFYSIHTCGQACAIVELRPTHCFRRTNYSPFVVMAKEHTELKQFSKYRCKLVLTDTKF